VPAGATAH